MTRTKAKVRITDLAASPSIPQYEAAQKSTRGRIDLTNVVGGPVTHVGVGSEEGAASDLRWGSERRRWPRRIFVWGFGRGRGKIEVGFLDDRSAASSSGTAPPPRAQELGLRTGAPPPRAQEPLRRLELRNYG
ncbi:uncharacterized protein A4U43_C03F13250 [Asparagus officinalis]|uniref:Uncharacterized protein n=1 Tax=Asparagus officinalis TaxID=4686 RepID=A0A5P1FAG6_ASPOF|nr:uncharacterized protein A4U43_C03F13250 [Asparagus officinalis]